MTDKITYTWRPSAVTTPGMVHATIEGQTRRYDHYTGDAWVWSVCAWQVDPDSGEQPGSIRCKKCLDWVLTEARKREERPRLLIP